ncbi:hypothetical protein AVEN_104758-1 [Araneus ventricosus]|uniref:Uncharacterized protein n=1 Tax=Araneus ventricosus TaxID=182803 RepID=A0A4Y2UW37_ARAVE|nr:hypothetical protein AVEN_104758-1 [Araneus ventricosus]
MPIRRRVPPVARTYMPRQAVRTTGFAISEITEGVFLFPISEAFRITRVRLTRSRRRVPPVASTYMPHQAARTTSSSHLYATSGGAYHRWLAMICPIRRLYHRWLALECFIRRCVPPTI